MSLPEAREDSRGAKLIWPALASYVQDITTEIDSPPFLPNEIHNDLAKEIK